MTIPKTVPQVRTRTPSILFFDDYPLQSENVVFLARLRRLLRPDEPSVDLAKTFRRAEELLRTTNYGAIILDIMARVPSDQKTINGNDERVQSSLAGVELLQRCRVGQYGPRNQQKPIFMRTARGEPDVRRRCNKAGATGYYLAGTDDNKLIENLKDLCYP